MKGPLNQTNHPIDRPVSHPVFKPIQTSPLGRRLSLNPIPTPLPVSRYLPNSDPPHQHQWSHRHNSRPDVSSKLLPMPEESPQTRAFTPPHTWNYSGDKETPKALAITPSRHKRAKKCRQNPRIEPSVCLNSETALHYIFEKI